MSTKTDRAGPIARAPAKPWAPANPDVPATAGTPDGFRRPLPPAAVPAQSRAAPNAAPVWRQDDGTPVSCVEKIKVLNENHAELRQIAQDAFEDALLMGCSEAQLRALLHALIDELDNPYRDSKKPG
jgi:hypothetical protein